MSRIRGKDVGLAKVGRGTAGSFAATVHSEGNVNISSLSNELLAELIEDPECLTDEEAAELDQFAQQWQQDNPWGVHEEIQQSVEQRLLDLRSDTPDIQEDDSAQAQVVPDNHPVASAYDAALISVGRNPDDQIDALIKYSPGILPGQARALLHQTVEDIQDRGTGSTWKKSLDLGIDYWAGRQQKPILAMSAPSGAAGRIRDSVHWAVTEREESVETVRLETHQKVPHLSHHEFDDLFDQAVERLKKGDDNWSEPLQQAVNLNTSKMHPEKKFDFEYTPPGRRGIEGYMGAQGYSGNLYDGRKNLNEINKDARAELKRAQKAGYLPDGIKFSVRGSKYSGGQSMYVGIKSNGLKSLIYNGTDEQVEQIQALKQAVSDIANSWNYSTSNSQVDYFNVNYYCSVQFDD